MCIRDRYRYVHTTTYERTYYDIRGYRSHLRFTIIRPRSSVLRLTAAGRGTEPAQNPTWEPGAATPSFLGESCGSKITSRLLVVVVLCTGFSACKGFGQMMVCGAVSCFECAPQNSTKNSSCNFQHHELPRKFHLFSSCILSLIHISELTRPY